MFAANGSPQAGAEMIGMLIELGADPDHMNHAGKTPREMAATLGREDVLKHMK